MSITRTLNTARITKLQSEPLWKKLKADCQKGMVFPAIRNDKIDFYYGGGKLFSYTTQGFSTHIKYAAVIANAKSDYISEKQLKKPIVLISDFNKQYDRIKENCKNYSGVEALGVSHLLEKFSYCNATCSSDVVVLDIEVVLNKKDRIDMLLYKQSTQELRFVEAKDYSNGELWSKSTPKIYSQIARYNTTIKVEKINILNAFSDYINIVNPLFSLNLPKPPKNINYKTKLYIFGFDTDQKKGRLTTTFRSGSSNVDLYCKGKPKNITVLNSKTLW